MNQRLMVTYIYLKCSYNLTREKKYEEKKCKKREFAHKYAREMGFHALLS